METLTPAPAPLGAVPSANPHVLLRQLVGLALWVGILSMLMGVAAFIVCSTLAALTFTDAWKSGIYKRPDRSGFLNISPMAWGIAMAFLCIVAYPAYLLHRSELRTLTGTNAFYWALVVAGAFVILACVGNLVLWM
jgi:hypothetical protein